MTIAFIEECHRLADAWRGCLVEVDAAVFWIKLAIIRGEPVPARTVRRYSEYVKLVSIYEDQMNQLGIEFVRDAI